MDFSDSFYVTLPSNVRSYTHVENTIANYTTKLPQRIVLQGKWEVSLVEISYTKSWYNINETCELVMCAFINGEKNVMRGQMIPSGRYDSIGDFVDIIQILMENYFKGERPHGPVILPELTYNKYSRKLTIKQGRMLDKVLFFCPNEYLCEKLGITYGNLQKQTDDRILEYETEFQENAGKPEINLLDRKQTYNELVYNGDVPIQLDAGCQSLFVYSDIVKYSLIGDSYAPILRLVEVPTTAHFGEQVVIPYPSPHYVPLAIQEFDSIEINVRDDTNATIPFEFGRTILKLHFRQSL